MIWVGTDDGLIQLTTDDGKTLAERDAAGDHVVEPGHRRSRRSHFDARTRPTRRVDRHQLSDFGPHIYRTRDRGKTWQEIIARSAGRRLRARRQGRSGATRAARSRARERGAFVSFDDGDNWQSLQLNLPVTSVRDFEVYGNDLIVGTHGRGFWVIDDISPLRQLTPTRSHAPTRICSSRPTPSD